MAFSPTAPFYLTTDLIMVWATIKSGLRKSWTYSLKKVPFEEIILSRS
ncbi:unnamed protein product [Penicillium salamii]|nr:unnamed protein product [Penicillium salamii]